MESHKPDIVVIGAGIIGLATARLLAKRNGKLNVMVLDKEGEVAQHQTGHNSGVIHAGIYYTPGSQKADYCWVGNTMLRRYCDSRGIPYRLVGKLIVAVSDSEIPMLEELARKGISNGVQGLEVVGRERLLELEPHAAGIKALYSPNTGIVNYADIAKTLVGDIVDYGGELVNDVEVIRIDTSSDGVHLETSRGVLKTRYVINCAGLQADLIAKMMGIETGLQILPFRGEYYSLVAEWQALVNGLIYPTPDPDMPFLGIHLSKCMDGKVEAGPNAVLALAREGYKKTDMEITEIFRMVGFPGFWRMAVRNVSFGIQEELRSIIKPLFARSIRRLLPEINTNDIGEPNSGVRAQAVDRNGDLLQDFRIVKSANSVHVLNAPSPGATACFPIADYIVGLAQKIFGIESEMK